MPILSRAAMPFLCCVAIAVAVGVAFYPAAAVHAELPNPRLLVVSPAGGQQGTQVEVTIEGDDLDEATDLIFSHPGITATAKLTARPFETAPQPFSTTYTVTVAKDAPPGFHDVRVAGRFGVSSPRTFEVSDLPQVAETSDNHAANKAMPLPLDTVVNGKADPDQFDYYTFEAKAGQTVTVLCVARAIDSRVKALVTVLNAAGEQMRFGRSTHRREPVVHFTAPADGAYLVKIADAMYQGGSPFFYRLVVSTRPFIDSVWPPVAAPGSTGTFTLFGHNLPGGIFVPDASPADAGLEHVEVQIAAPNQPQVFGLSAASTRHEPHEIEVQGFEHRLASPQGPSNPFFISLTSLPVIVEEEPRNDFRAQPQPLTLPCEVVGRFYADRDRDWFSFEGKKGEAYSVEVFSERLSLPTDPSLLVEHVAKDAAGKETVRTVVEHDEPEQRFTNQPFDAPTHDPAVHFTADADGTYRVVVRDLYAGSSAQKRHVYRLVVRQADAEFQLVATCKALVELSAFRDVVYPANPTLCRGGTQTIKLQAYRRGGFNGSIMIAVEGLPPGVTCLPVPLAAGEHQATVVLTAAADAPAWRGPIKVVGTATLRDGAPEARREAFFSTPVWNKGYRNVFTDPRVRHDTILSVIEEQTPLRVVFAEDKVWEVSRAGKLTIPFKFERHHELQGSMQVELRGMPASYARFDRAPSAVFEPQANDGKIELTIPATMPPGEYPAYLATQVKLAYPRNPEAAVRAEARKQEFAATLADLAEKSKAADAARAEAEKKVTELAAVAGDASQSAAITSATDGKNKAIEAAKTAADNLRAATEEKKAIDKRAVDLTEAAKPKETVSFISSAAVILRVIDAPIVLTTAPSAPIAPGAGGEIPLSLKRLFDFTQQVDVEAQLPAGVIGITLDKMPLPAGVESGKIVVKAAADATPGTHKIILRAKLTYNGQALQIEHPVDVTIQPPAKSEPAAQTDAAAG